MFHWLRNERHNGNREGLERNGKKEERNFPGVITYKLIIVEVFKKGTSFGMTNFTQGIIQLRGHLGCLPWLEAPAGGG